MAFWFDDSKTRGAADRCHRQTPKKTLRLRKSEPRNRGNDLLHAQGPPLVQVGGGVELVPCSSRPERPSVPRARADCGGRLFTAKLGVVVHYLLHQLLDHLLADDAILLARQFCDRLRDRVDHFVGFIGVDFVDAAVAGYSAKKSSISSTIMQ